MHIINDDQLYILYFIFIFLIMVFNNSSLFMSISYLIQINIHFMDMKRSMLIFFSYACWWTKKKNEVVIKWR
jgi:hypothetical protein